MENPNPSLSKDSTTKSPSHDNSLIELNPHPTNEVSQGKKMKESYNYSPVETNPIPTGEGFQGEKMEESHDDSPIETNPNPTNEGSQAEKMDEDIVPKTPLEVLAEISSNELDKVARGGSSSLEAISLVTDGGVRLVEIGSANKIQQRKRKNHEILMLPIGQLTCPICRIGFLASIDAFDHMKTMHTDPDRSRLGHFPFPVLTKVQPLEHDLNEGVGGDEVANMEVGGPSNRGADERSPAPAPENMKDKRKKLGIDLNLPPPSEEDEE